VPPWSHNTVSRLTKTPKLHFLDTGLLAALRDATASQLQKDRTSYGPLLENFVVSEVIKLTTWSDKRLRISHFRTKDQDEVDLVLEDRRGRVIGIEVKASATVRPQDLRGLRQLQAAVGDKFVQGLVLHDHDCITPFDEKLHAGPVSLLWQSLAS
jgi:predicted AAA+ superfamily ATPase